MTSEGLRAVTFDWWHTVAEPHAYDPFSGDLRSWEAFSREARVQGLASALRAHAVGASEADVARAYDAWVDDLRELWRSESDLTAGEQVLGFLEQGGWSGAASPALLGDLEEAIGAPLVLQPPRIHEGFDAVARELRRRGLRVGLISNTGRTWGRFLRRVQEQAGIADVFDATVFSDEVRCRKPARGIFLAALEALGVDARHAVHVGDDAEADVRGAQAIGMRAVHCDHGRRLDCAFADARIHGFGELLGVLARW